MKKLLLYLSAAFVFLLLSNNSAFAQVPVITYTSPDTLATNQAYTLSPTNSGGAVTAGYTINGSATTPASLSAIGLTFNSTTGVISGTPTATLAATSYSIIATNGSGPSTAFSLSILVLTGNQVAPVISYLTPDTYIINAAVSLSPTNSNSANTASYAITAGTLPAGLTLATGTGIISGTANTVTATTTVTITASTTGNVASGSTTVTITVNSAAPVISYTPSTSIFSPGTTITPLTPTNTGGAVATSGTIYGPGTTILTSAAGSGSLSEPYGMAVDAAGDVFVTNFSGNSVTEYSTTGVITTYSTGAGSGPVGLVFDALGNAYVLEQTADKVVEFALGMSGAQTTIINTNLSKPTGIAISGTTLYIANSGNSTITEYTTAGVLSKTITTGGGFFNFEPVSGGIAVDSSGDIYVVSNLSFFGFTFSTVNEYNSTGTLIHRYRQGNNNAGLYIDGNQNIFLTSIGNNRVSEYTAAFATNVANESGLSGPRGVVTDATGNLYVSNYSNNTVTKYPLQLGYFISSPLPAGLSFNTTTGVISGAPTAAFSATTYTITAYNSSGSGSTTVTLSCVGSAPIISYSPSTNVYTLNATITPLAPTVSGGPIIAASYITPGTSLTGTVSAPWGMTQDASGDIWVVNSGNNTVNEYGPTGTFIKTLTITGTANTLTGIAISGTTIYLTSTGGRVYSTTTTTGAAATFANPGGSLDGIAIDASGNLYVSDVTNGRIRKITSGGVISTFVNLTSPTGVAVNGAGYIFTVDQTSGDVKEYNSAGTPVANVITLLGTNVYGLYMDSHSDYYIADPGAGKVYEYNEAGTLITTITGLTSPRGLTTDASGDLYVADFTTGKVTEYPPVYYVLTGSLGPGLSFNTTTGTFSGTPTAAFGPTTYTITVYGSYGSASTTVTLSCVGINNWTGFTSTDWNVGTNWSTGVVPTAAQVANIGVNVTFNFFPTVGPAGVENVTVGSIVIGNTGGKAGGFVVNTGSTLAVGGAITYQSDVNSSLINTASISGGGSVTASSLNVIANTTPTPTAASYTETMTSSVTSMVLSGNIALTSSNSGANIFNSTLNITGGIVSLAGIIQTANTASSTSTFTVTPTTTATLQLSNAAALSGFSATGTNSINFDNLGATIEYSGAAQTIYCNDFLLPGMTSVWPDYYNLKFSGTGIKTPNGNGINTIMVDGDFTNALTLNDASDYINLSSPAVFFNGSANQNIYGGNGTGTTFYNVSFFTTGTATIQSGEVYIASSGSLSMGGATSTVLAANGLLTLNSDATGSAAVSPIPAFNTISGNVNVQRFITGGAGYRGYRQLSSPVWSGTVVSSNDVCNINYLQLSSYLTGAAGGGFDKTGNPTLYLYRQDQIPLNTTFTDGNFWGISSISSAPTYSVTGGNPSTTATFNIPVGNGYLFFFRGDRSKATVAAETTTTYVPTNTTLTATGTLNQGSINVVDWYTPGSANLGYTTIVTGAGNATVRGFNLVGNPYASSIDWDTFNTTTSSTGIFGSNVASFSYIFDAQTQNYSVYQSGTGGVGTIASANANIIPSGQGFFVQATNTGAQLVFNEDAKSYSQASAANGNLFLGMPKQAAVIQSLHLKLTRDSITSAVNTDGIFIVFNKNASSNYSPGEDAPYRTGTGSVSLSSMSADNVSLAINQMPLPTQSLKIPLTVKANATGLYQLNMVSVKSIAAIHTIWLKDAYKKDSLDIRANPVYSFNIDKTDTNSFGANRFSLVMGENPALAIHLLNFNASKATNGSEVVWETENEQNYTNFTVERSTDGGVTFDVLGGFASSALGTYSFLDKDPAITADMYRLKIEDLNGTISYSKVVTLIYGNGNNLLTGRLNVYPNPSSDVINLAIPTNVINNSQTNLSGLQTLATTPGLVSTNSGVTSSYDIKIISITGAVIKSATSASTNWQGSVSDLTPGTYIIQVINNSDKSLVGRNTFVKL